MPSSLRRALLRKDRFERIHLFLAFALTMGGLSAYLQPRPSSTPGLTEDFLRALFRPLAPLSDWLYEAITGMAPAGFARLFSVETIVLYGIVAFVIGVTLLALMMVVVHGGMLLKMGMGKLRAGEDPEA